MKLFNYVSILETNYLSMSLEIIRLITCIMNSFPKQWARTFIKI